MNTLSQLDLILSGLSAMYPRTSNLLKLLGALLLLRKVLSVLGFLYRSFLRARRNLKKRYGASSWALVTGSSDGIGKAIAF